ncbi:NAD-dependent deacylase [Anaeroselena agilis]|uniref:protein acetyllysine N-acetyltransferase n=1 Tax=Anaeroselena agilis TaxID=3063788 RepID=A0ABU3P518_9FIRM|nr:NAD-dependent deacylase [Selenomonadales bacterium 4137-cl]
MMAALLDEVAAAWSNARYPVVFTGAGMSTESGLPDFRSARGLWKQRPESLATMAALRRDPGEFYFFYQWRIARLWEAAPNAGHAALAALASAGFVRRLITQNVDGLHQRAGGEAVELHGTLRTVSCLGCGAGYDSRQLLPARTGWEEEYRSGRYRPGKECICPGCGGSLRPDVVLFGESLPGDAWDEAARVSRAADLFVVVGSSLAVGPANLCPEFALESGARLVIVNREATHLDGRAEWVFHDKAAGVLAAIRERIIG